MSEIRSDPANAAGVPADQPVEQALGTLLLTGVVAAAAVVLIGGVLFLLRHGNEPTDLRVFHGEPADLRSPTGIFADALEMRSRGIIQLGILMLMATPVARVLFSVFAFARQRDWVYVVITLIVLAVLVYSMFSGYEG